MRIAVLYSGGKDSNLSAAWAIYQGWDVILVGIKSEEYSMMFHHQNVDNIPKQAKKIGLKLEMINTTMENELEDLEKKLKELKVDGIVSGAIASEYQKQRIDGIGEKLGIPTYAPLWHKEDVLMDDFKYFEIYISGVSAEGLGEELLGTEFREFSKNIHPLFEGGEGETFVTDGPIFKSKLKVKKWEKKWDGIRGSAEAVI